MHLNSLTDEELYRYARDNARTPLERELAVRLELLLNERDCGGGCCECCDDEEEA